MADKNQNESIQKMYDQIIPDVYKNNYEYERWFKDQRNIQDYLMTHETIRYQVSKCNFSSCIELGPGPGTWTRVLYRQSPAAHYTLVDISKEMKKQFQLEMRDVENVNYIVSDLYDVDITEKVDLFFSSRAIEYIEDKKRLFQKVVSLLNPGGKGIIITKNPHYFRLKGVFAGQQRKHHQGQLSPIEVKEILEGLGVTDIQFYPCIYRLPLIDRVTYWVSWKLFNKSYTKESSRISAFAESYVVVFSV